MSFMEQFCKFDPEIATDEEIGEVVTEAINFYYDQLLCDLDYPPEDVSFVMSAVSLLYRKLMHRAKKEEKYLSRYYDHNIGFIVPPPSEITEKDNENY